MASNSVVTASIAHAAKDLGKKKRANRSAKLKQCKLDARREQWLSHVRSKICKEERNEVFGGEIRNPSGEVVVVVVDKSDGGFNDVETRGHLDSDSESQSPGNSPMSSVLGVNELGSGYNGGDTSSSSSSGRSCSSSSSFSSGGCCSGSITEEEDDGCLDDWEAVADALAADDGPPKDQSLESGTEKEVVKPEVENAAVGVREAASTQAWRADDAFRPQSLPSLLTQKSFPMNSEKHSGRAINPWGRNPALSVPTSCPICYEDLDLTDSSFLPCLCGFRLCLFCHKRILEGDGRCPGCRKPYELDSNQKEVSVTGGCASVRLARSCSMFSRT